MSFLYIYIYIDIIHICHNLFSDEVNQSISRKCSVVKRVVISPHRFFFTKTFSRHRIGE